jgi:ABC-type transport system substrate-binding protein
VLADQVNIPLWFGKTFIVYSENVENVQYSPTDQLLLTEVSVTQ